MRLDRSGFFAHCGLGEQDSQAILVEYANHEGCEDLDILKEKYGSGPPRPKQGFEAGLPRNLALAAASGHRSFLCFDVEVV